MRFVVPDLHDPNAHPRAVRRAVGHQAAAVRQAFRDHNERIRPLLTPPLQRLQEMSLHDALFQSLRIDPGQKTLQLCLLCDDRNGYFDLTLIYRNIRLSQQEISLLCLLAQADAEVDRDELDLDPDGREQMTHDGTVSPVFIHRISWHTSIETSREAAGFNTLGEECYRIATLHPEMELHFGDLGLETTRRSDRQLSRAQDYIAIVRDPNQVEGMAPLAATL